MKVRVKICGMCRARDVDAAIAAGADALGFVFAASSRQLGASRARELLARVPDSVTRVGVFLDPTVAEVQAVLAGSRLDLLQFHGREEDAWCAQFGLPFVKAVSMGAADPGRVARQYTRASGILFDSHPPGGAGGTGDRFDWSLLPVCAKPVWLAGGLHPGNVAAAVRMARPWAVDVASGVEDRPGVKNRTLMEAFVQAARAAAREM